MLPRSTNKRSITVASVLPSIAALCLTACGGLGGNIIGSSERLVVWDGEAKTTGLGWAEVDQKDLDKATIQISDESAFSGDKAVQFQAAGEKWMGLGWTWLPKWDGVDGQGVDTSPYEMLTFMIRAEGPKPTTRDGLNLAISSNNEHWSRNVKLADYSNASLLNGEWHKVSIPLTSFTGPNKEGIDKTDMKDIKTILLGTYSSVYSDFNLYIDDIAFE